MSEHIVTSYDDELVRLGEKISQMGGLAEKQLADAISALSRRDLELADAVIAKDERIDMLEREVEEQSILMIARRQPMARDLREIMAAIKISSDLERVGDLAKNIAKRVLAISGEGSPKRLVVGVEHMSQIALEQLKNTLDAFAQRDAERAMDVWRRDEEIDSMYNSLFRELLTYMMEDPRNISLCTHLLFGAKNIERIGDHCTNVAETVYYLVHGKPLTADRPKKDRTALTAVPATPQTDQ
jgi:phosphate transport system protein